MGSNVKKSFMDVIYKCSQQARVFGPDRPLQPSLIFAGKARCPSTQVGSICKHYTRLESLARDKHSSLLGAFLNYGCKEYYNISFWSQPYETSMVNKLGYLTLVNIFFFSLKWSSLIKCTLKYVQVSMSSNFLLLTLLKNKLECFSLASFFCLIFSRIRLRCKAYMKK